MRIKIAVTGGGGFIGKEILLELLRNNFHAISFQRTIQNNAEVEIRYFDLSNIDDKTSKILFDVDTVIHAAALVHKEDSDSSDQISLNFESTKRLFEVCEKAKVSKFIFLSTVAVYGLISSKEKIDIKIASDKIGRNPTKSNAPEQTCKPTEHRINTHQTRSIMQFMHTSMDLFMQKK